jgi:hypothetical protein
LSRRTNSWLAGLPCIFCGGFIPATTTEHAPPRILFLRKQRPREHEFPSCARCNNGSSQLDQVASMMTFVTGEAFYPGKFRAEFEKTAIGVRNNVPEVLQYLELDAAHSVNASLGDDGPELIAVPVGRKLFSHWLHPWAAKQTFAMWNRQTDSIIRPDQRVIVRWIPNPVDVAEDFLETIKKTMKADFHLSQGRVSFSDQFFYKYAISDDKELGAFFLILHEVTAILCFVMSESFTREFHIARYGEIYETKAETGITRTL